jgi:hypothetical protein
MPYRKQQVAACANVPTARIVQRFRTLTSLDVVPTIRDSIPEY